MTSSYRQNCLLVNLETEVEGQKWQGKLITARMEDDDLNRTGCFRWLTVWKTCLTHTTAGMLELSEQLLPTRLYISQKTHKGPADDVMCRLQGSARESVLHIYPDANCCLRISTSSYKMQFWKYHFSRSCARDLDLIEVVPPWYLPTMPKPMYESENVQAFWDVPIFAEHQEVRTN